MADRPGRPAADRGERPTAPSAFSRLVTDLLPQIIRITDAAGGAIYLNAQWQRYTGLDIPASLGLGWQQALHPDDRPHFLESWAKGTATDTDFIIEYRLRRADGVFRWFESHAVPAGSETGAPTIWLSSLTDIDDRHQAERERDAVLGAIAHDLRSPLATLVGRAQLTQRRLGRIADPSAPALAADLGRLVSTAQHMATMVAELADLARMSRGVALDLDIAPVDLVGLLRDVAADARDEHVGRELRVEATAGPIIGEWDATRIKRAIANLIGNAMKYSEPPAPVTVSLARERADGRDWAVLRVRDEGIGIPAADLPRVFERFFRAANAVGRAPGTGIGLAGVRQIVAQHGGDIAIESVEGEGTSVTMRLPLVEQSER